jgi:DNA adenine methylase
LSKPESAITSSEDYPDKDVKPFLKWVGGKQQLLAQFQTFFPSQFKRYIEPFAGGAAVYFHLWGAKKLPRKNYLFDNNEELINAYRTVRDNIEELIELLVVHQKEHSKDYYYHIRNLDRNSVHLSDVERTARTIYLNRTGYNGLYRVNSKGFFNVPIGSYKNPQILYTEVLKNASRALQGVTIEVSDFRETERFGKPGDFFYFDPPYDPVSRTSSFTGYTAYCFGDEDQHDLARVYSSLTKKGCLCMLSNSHTNLIRELYKRFHIEIVQAKRAVNSNANGRGNIDEVVVLNY